MKKIMKKALSLALALVMILSLAPMTAWAAEGSMENPYQLSPESERFYVYVQPGESAYVQASEANGTVEVGYATAGDWFIQYGKFTTIYPETESGDYTATLVLEGYDTFSVYNAGEEAVSVYMTFATSETAEDTVGTMDDPEIVEFVSNEYTGAYGANLTAELEAGAEGYYYRHTATEDGALVINVSGADADWNPVGCMLVVNNITAGIYGDYLYSDEYGYVETETVPVNAGDVVDIFVNTYNPENMWGNPAGKVYTNIGFATVGSADYPQTVIEGVHTATLEEGAGEYYYTYTATKAGTVTVTMADENTVGWTYSVSNLTAVKYGDTHWNDDEPVVKSESVDVAVGDEVKIVVSTYDPEDMWNTPAGTVKWTLDFEADKVADDEDDVTPPTGDEDDVTPPADDEDDVTPPAGDEDDVTPPADDEDDVTPPADDDTEAPVAGEEIKEGYFYNYQTFEVDKTYDLCPNTSYDVTLYVFEPTEVGSYTFKVTNGKVGYYGTNLYFPFNDAELTDTVTVNYTDTTLMSSIIIGVSEASLPALTITSGEAKEEVKIPEYMLGVSANAYIFTGDASKLQYVDIEGSVENKAVYASDGYYHLNTTDGPILLVDLTDDIVNLSAATATGKVVIVDYNEAGEVIRKWNYNNVIDTCVANSDSKTGLYPLTSELMSIYKVYGEQQGWYTETGYVSSLFANPGEDAWMFACQYIPNAADGTIEKPPVVVPLPTPDKDDSASAGATPGTGTEDDSVVVEEVVFTKEDMKDSIEEAIKKEMPVVIVPTVGNDSVVFMEFNPVELKDAGDFKLNVTVAVKDDVKDETVAKNEKITADIFVLKIEFSHEGPLPGTATIKIDLPEAYKTYKQLYYYQIMADGSLRYECDAIVKDGKAIVTQDHCSDYVLLTEKIVEDTTTDTTPDTTTPDVTTPDATTPDATTPDASPKTGDSSNIALWVAILGLGVVAIAGSVVMKKREF